jgi:hypothetical protein
MINHYERAFAEWLEENKVKYLAIDEKKRSQLGRGKVKSFDYLLYPPDGDVLIAEIKGRKFHGTSLKKLQGLQCWVTTDDVEGLVQWQGVFGDSHAAVFVFSYYLEQPDIDPDGRDIFEFEGSRYVFFVISVDDYRACMKLRSPRWKTVTLPAQKFRQLAYQL